MRYLALFLSIFFLFQSPVTSTTYNIYPTTLNWIAILGSLQPGDIAYIHAGTYIKTAKLSLSLLGTASAPILVSGVQGEVQPVISHSGQNQNIIDLVEGNYFTIQNITLTGGSLGLRLGPSATKKISNGIIQYLIVHDTAETAISANFAGHTYTNLTFRRNEIYNTGTNTGECFYFGSSDGTGVIRNSLIVDNLCHDTLQATSGSLGSAIQLKDGSYSNTIQDNVCYRIKGPCVLLYSDRGLGRNKVVGNVVLSTNDNGIQAAAGATIINNLILNTGGDGVAIVQNPSGVTIANITLLHNTVVDSAGKCFRLTNFVSSRPFLVANNALYCPNSVALYAPGSTTQAYYKNGYSGGSLPTGVPSSGFFALGTETADLTNRASNNLYPTSTSTLLNKGNSAYSVNYDFNYLPRPTGSSLTVGAYQRSTATNPGWAVTTNFKPPTTFIP